jgi:hypothetical protein
MLFFMGSATTGSRRHQRPDLLDPRLRDRRLELNARRHRPGAPRCWDRGHDPRGSRPDAAALRDRGGRQLVGHFAGQHSAR